MKLLTTHTSPFGRKCAVLAHEVGLSGRVEVINLVLADKPVELVEANPLAKVPALIMKNETLYDSPVICEYLDNLGTNAMFPPAGPARWSALRLQALADGICDAGVLVFYENKRAETERSPAWITKQNGVIARGLAELEREASGFDQTLNVGTIAIACVLSWMTFRNTFGDWEADHPALAKWQATFEQRPSMKMTAPPADA